MTDSISILGCGWMGRPIGAHLAASGLRVHGSTTTPEKLERLRDDGIEPFRLELSPDLQGTDPGRFFDTKVLFLNVPPPVRQVGSEDLAEYHTRQIQSVLDHLADRPIDWVIFASSTGVYPKTAGRVVETDQPPGRPDAMTGPRRSTGRVLIDVEGRLADHAGVDVTILRFAGLYGGDRHPGRFLAGRSNVGRPEAPVNLVHQEDCVGVVDTVLRQDARGEVFNVCATEHPTRRELYTGAARALDLEPPTFDEDTDSSGKIVSNERLRTVLGYRLRHPDPLADLAPTAS
jgi:nucleoside-diphosphate-sugar epimerase